MFTVPFQLNVIVWALAMKGIKPFIIKMAPNNTAILIFFLTTLKYYFTIFFSFPLPYQAYLSGIGMFVSLHIKNVNNIDVCIFLAELSCIIHCSVPSGVKIIGMV